ncbi:hypothetical protein HPP92_010811 [Vanilla planifolia]|uniref:BAH domain-containing protein n=1 Tax=Vanilla planifolia TaxID=51239 RepID=A0A835QXU5_VANPL|nr:hypothetical protein HPP92_010811 [Vanilla planifolia]
MSKRPSPEPSSSTEDQEQNPKKLKDQGEDSTKEETELKEAHFKEVEVKEGETVSNLEEEEKPRKENEDRETEKKQSIACEEVGAGKQGKVEEAKEEVDRSKGEGCPGGENAATAEEEEELAKPVGTVVRSSGRGRNKMHHYAAFEIHEKVIELEEAMLLVPEQPASKPYIGILKDVKAKPNGGRVTVLVQWLYRGEEALREGDEPLTWPARDRELFLSFHCDEVTADAVMHKCVVHYVTPEVDVEEAKARRYGFFVQKVYDVRKKVLWDLTDVVAGGSKNGFREAERKQVERLLRQTEEDWESSTPTTTTTQTSPTPV